jgi:hypothetical protein
MNKSFSTVSDVSYTLFTICAVLVAVALGSCHPVHASENTISRADIIKTLDHMRLIVKDSEAKSAIAQTELEKVQEDAKKVTDERDWYKNDDAKKDEQLVEKDKVIAQKNHKLNILGIALATVCSMLAFQLLGLLTPALTPAFALYGTAARFGIAALVFSAVYAWVRYF